MAYGNITGYIPTQQPGAYLFQQRNGPPQMLYGAPAEQLKARLDASSGLAGQAVAGPGGGAPGDAGGVPANSVMAGSGALNAPAPAPEPAMSVAPAAPPPAPLISTAPVGPIAEGMPVAPSPEAREMAQQLAGPTEGVAPVATAQGASAPPTPTALGANGINFGVTQLPNGQLAVRTPGVAAVTQEQLLKKYGEGQQLGSGQGVAAPHSVSETTTGGFDPSADYLERRADLAIDKRLAIDKASDVEAENAVREKQIADQQFQMAADFKAEEQARTAQITAQVQKDLETRDRLQKELGNAKVNPNRIFSGTGGTWRAIGAALAAGLGAAGSGLQAMGGHPGAPNLAFQAIQSAIDRDISAQENEIKIKGTLADNALTQYMRSGQSLEQAKLGLRSAQLQWVAAQNQQSAAMTKGSQVEPRRDMLHNEVLSALNDSNEAYRQGAIGTRTKQVASQVVYPHAGGGGGLRLYSPDEAMAFAAKNAELGAKTAGTAKTLAETAKTRAEAQNAGKPKNAGAINTALENLDIAGATIGLTPTDNDFEGEASWTGRSGGGYTVSETTQKYNAAIRAAAPSVLAAHRQRVSPDAIDDFVKQHQSWSGGQIKDMLVATKRSLKIAQQNPSAESSAAPAEGTTQAGEGED